jgi:diguanylate cyclase (GGDEF)-like protein
MKLQSKVLIILAGVWAVIALLVFVDAKFTLVQTYQKIETHQINSNLNRTQKAFNNMLTSLRVLTNDWSNWDDLYSFMQQKNQKFISSNMLPTTFENPKLNFILFFDAQQKFYYGKYYDFDKKILSDTMPSGLISFLESHIQFMKRANDAGGKVGLFKIPEGYVVMSFLPILTSDAKGPIRGTIMMGYFLNDKQIQKLSETLEMNLKFFALPLQNNDAGLQKIAHDLQISGNYGIQVQNDKAALGYILLKDIDSKPAGMFQVDFSRTLYSEVLDTVQHYVTILILLGVLVLLTMWYLLKIFVLNRISNVSQQIISIKNENDFSQRIHISGTDELVTMVSSVNSMLDIIEASEEELKYRITLRTEELENLSRLNKNLSSEIEVQRDIETQLRKDEKQLRSIAYYDSLTGLPNRALFYELLQDTLLKSEREKNHFAILFLDADKLKKVNDEYGHLVGDQCIKYIANVIKQSIKDIDIVVRLAGDEFIIVLQNVTDKEMISSIAQRILQNASKPYLYDGNEIYISYSIGISLYPKDGTTIDDLLMHADIAMYFAKKQSGNSFCYYDAISEDHLLKNHSSNP